MKRTLNCLQNVSRNTVRGAAYTLAGAAFFTLTLSSVAQAGNPAIAEYALQGYDAVSYHENKKPIEGVGNYSTIHDGQVYLFASQDNKQTFEADPEKYVPAYNGFCAFGVVKGMQLSGDPEVWRVRDGKLYLNVAPRIQEKWLEAPAQHIQTANENWKGMDQSNFSAPAAQGYDLVSFFENEEPLEGNGFNAAEHNGATYLFASEENQKTFEANPEKYLPAYNGYCAFGAAKGMKVAGDPEIYRIVDGKLYFNLNTEIQDRWIKDIPGHIEKANENWKEIKNDKPTVM